MFQRAFMIGLLSVLPMLGSGCQLGPSEPAKAGNSAPDRAAVPADERPEAQAEPAQAEKSAKTREVTVAVTGMT